MTATIISWDQLVQTSSEKKMDGASSTKTQSAATTVPDQEDLQVRTRTTNSNTEINNEQLEAGKTAPLPVNRIYPHVFDEDIKAGQALIYLRSAISDANEALDAFGEPDLQEVSTRLTHIAVAMSKAHLLTDFNESLGSVVSYVVVQT